MNMNERGLQFNDDDNASFYVSDFCRGFKKYWWVIAIISVVFCVFSVFNCYRSYVPRYKAEVTFTVSTQDRASINGITAYNFYYDASTASHLSETFPGILSSKLLQDAVAADLQLTSIPVSLTASSVSGSNMFTLCAEGYEPQLTYDVLISTMENYPEIAKYVVGNIKFNVIRSPILPEKPHNDPGYFNGIFKGVTYGLLLGLILLLCYTVLRTTVRTKKDIRNNLNIKCLGVIPHIILKKNSKESTEPLLISSNLTDERFSDSFRSLRSILKKMLRNDKKVIAVTSTIADEGKTTVCVNMALSFALIGKKVLLADCDTNGSGVLKKLRVNEDELNYSIVTDKYKIAYLDKHKIYVMKLVDDGNKKEAINSDNLAAIFSSLKVNYDLIFVDTAPCGTDSDALFVAQASDGVLYVILQDTVRISRIQDALDSLLSIDSEILGSILNGAQTSIMGYGYYKAYNKYGYYKSYGKYGKYGKYGSTDEYGYGFSFEDNIEN